MHNSRILINLLCWCKDLCAKDSMSRRKQGAPRGSPVTINGALTSKSIHPGKFSAEPIRSQESYFLVNNK